MLTAPTFNHMVICDRKKSSSQSRVQKSESYAVYLKLKVYFLSSFSLKHTLLFLSQNLAILISKVFLFLRQKKGKTNYKKRAHRHLIYF